MKTIQFKIKQIPTTVPMTKRLGKPKTLRKEIPLHIVKETKKGEVLFKKSDLYKITPVILL